MSRIWYTEYSKFMCLWNILKVEIKKTIATQKKRRDNFPKIQTQIPSEFDNLWLSNELSWQRTKNEKNKSYGTNEQN